MDRSQYNENRKYKSNLTGEYINCAQWCAEILVKRKADKQGVVLPYKFWTIDGIWKNEFIKQISKIHQLIKEFNEQSIINFINNNPKVFSVRPKYNIEKIAQEHLKLINTEIKPSNIELSSVDNFKMRKNNKKTLFGKLNDN